MPRRIPNVEAANDRIMRMHELASKIALKNGIIGSDYSAYNKKNIIDLWDYNDRYPTPKELESKIKTRAIKWYIRNKLKIDDPIWNGDFMHGLSKHGVLNMNKSRFPSFAWNANTTVSKLVLSCPYGGFVNIKDKESFMNKWMYVPAFYLPYNENSLSFVAGILAGGVPFRRGNFMFAKYSYRVVPYLKNLGIPIEFSANGMIKKYSLISPFWPAIFSFAMPKVVSEMWLEIPDAYEANMYAAILWKNAIGHDFIPNGIPYLRSRRTIYYQFDCDMGAMKFLDKMKQEKGLYALDGRFSQVARIWEQNALKNKTKEI